MYQRAMLLRGVGLELNKAVRNERRKLTATFVNGIAIATVAVGGLAQAASMVQSAAVSPLLILFVAICFVLAVVLHWFARASLRGMEE